MQIIVDKNHILENIKYLRMKFSLTQGEFGALFGVSRDNIASYERGSEPRMDFISRVVDRFGLSFDDFIGTSLEERSIPVNFRSQEPADVSYAEDQRMALASEPAAEYQCGAAEPDKGPGWQNVPVYELGAATLSALFTDPQSFSTVDYFAASTLPRCDGGLRVSCDGMAPVIQSGDIAFYKQVNNIYEAIVWGQSYLLSFELDGDEYTTVRHLYPSDRPGFIRLVGTDVHLASKEVALSRIRALGLIKAVFRVNSLS